MLFPASVQPVVDASANVRVRDVDVISVYIDMQPIPFNRGYYSIDLTFFFDVSLELYGGATVGCERVSGISIFNKKVILYGSEGNVKMFTSESCRDEADLQGNKVLPKATVQVAQPVALSAKLSGDDYRVYTLVGDGEIQEGQVWEAAMLAGHRKLDNLVVIVDDNNLQIDGAIDEVNSPYPIDKKFEAFNFHVINVDGHDFDSLRAAFEGARQRKGMPTAIIAKTVKGKGVSYMENQASWHGVAPNEEQYKIAMEELEKAGEALCQK